MLTTNLQGQSHHFSHLETMANQSDISKVNFLTFTTLDEMASPTARKFVASHASKFRRHHKFGTVKPGQIAQSFYTWRSGAAPERGYRHNNANIQAATKTERVPDRGGGLMVQEHASHTTDQRRLECQLIRSPSPAPLTYQTIGGLRGDPFNLLPLSSDCPRLTKKAMDYCKWFLQLAPLRSH